MELPLDELVIITLAEQTQRASRNCESRRRRRAPTGCRSGGRCLHELLGRRAVRCLEARAGCASAVVVVSVALVRIALDQRAALRAPPLLGDLGL
jgi:hypothetical protein